MQVWKRWDVYGCSSSSCFRADRVSQLNSDWILLLSILQSTERRRWTKLCYCQRTLTVLLLLLHVHLPGLQRSPKKKPSCKRNKLYKKKKKTRWKVIFSQIISTFMRLNKNVKNSRFKGVFVVSLQPILMPILSHSFMHFTGWLFHLCCLLFSPRCVLGTVVAMCPLLDPWDGSHVCLSQVC